LTLACQENERRKAEDNMTAILVTIVIGFVVVTCFKAYHSVKLLEKDPEAWSRLQQAEDEKRRLRQEMIGKVLVGGWRMLCGNKEDGTEQHEKKGACP
jgi:hypothetical protein